ncbi:hypothetical protein NOR_07609 [Metarhizium rileyi]|uniref:Uncharacterized protein n=1 Tax=Metarhizium rileyi (strain RCEF 4871) TaxID=1649241 RepID=A0A166XWL6_METRR|nr:hypothetical protein NOR_07609 [Metarhizium rileyi RCEF 4871]
MFGHENIRPVNIILTKQQLQHHARLIENIHQANDGTYDCPRNSVICGPFSSSICQEKRTNDEVLGKQQSSDLDGLVLALELPSLLYSMSTVWESSVGGGSRTACTEWVPKWALQKNLVTTQVSRR